MVRRQHRALVLLLVGAVATFVAGCGSDDDDTTDSTTPAVGSGSVANTATSAGPEGTGDSSALTTLTIARTEELARLDPQWDSGVWVSTLYEGNVSESLIERGPEGELIPRLATEYELIDETTWRFHLQEGVTFHNGEAFNADAVVFSMERLVSEDSDNAPYFTGFDSIEKIDEYTVDIHLQYSNPDWPGMIAAYGRMVPPELTASSATAIQDTPVGTGPYKMDSHTADEVRLSKNSAYWGGTPAGPDVVVIRYIPEMSAALAALEAGEVDIVPNLPPDLADEAEATTISRGAEKFLVVINPFNGPTMDPKVREAIVHGIDSETIRFGLTTEELTTDGRCQFGAEGIAGYNPDLADQEYDAERAEALLEEAGATGATVRFVAPAALYANGEQIAELVAEQLQAIGLNVELEILPFDAFFDAILGPVEDRVELFFIAASFEVSVSQPYGPWVGPEQSIGVFPHDEYPEFVDQLEEGLRAADPEDRAELLNGVAQTICDANVYRFMWIQNRIWGHRQGISFPSRFNDSFPLVDVVMS